MIYIVSLVPKPKYLSVFKYVIKIVYAEDANSARNQVDAGELSKYYQRPNVMTLEVGKTYEL